MTPLRRSRPAWILCAAVLCVAALAAPRSRAESGVDVSDTLQKALEFYLNERYEESIQLFQQVLQADKNNDTAANGLRTAQNTLAQVKEKQRAQEKPAMKAAQHFMKRGQWVEAIDRLRLILKRVPDHPEALEMMEDIKAKVSRKHAAAKLNSSDWFYTKGVLAYLYGDWYQAATTWEQVYAFDQDKIFLVDKIDRAKRNLAEQQQQERLELYKTMAWDHFNSGRPDEAIQAWRQLLEADPDNPEALEGLRQAEEANVRLKERQRADAITDLSEKAMNSYLEGDNAKAREQWTRLLEMDPENVTAKEYLARMKERGRGGYSSGRSYTSSYSPSAGTASNYERGVAFYKEERYPEAIEALERHMARNPSDANAANLLQEMRAKQKDLVEKAYQEGLTAYSQGRPEEAIQTWQRCLRINPDFQKARQALIKALAESRKPR